MSATTSLLALVIILLSEKVNSISSVNVTRLQDKDKFTNPNHTAVSSCLVSGDTSSFVDSCKTFYSTDTRAKCASSSTCCGSCQCDKDYPIYLAHLGKCVNLVELNSDVFGPGSTGCGGRLQIKGGGGGDGDDDDDDDHDDRDGKHGKDVCKAKNWTPPLIDFLKSSSPKIKFCLVKRKDTERCNIQRAYHLGFDQWGNFTSFQQRFWTAKNKKDMYLQWNDSAVSHLTGNIVVINVSCKEKGPKGKYFTSCFMFKTAGTHVVIKTLATTTTPVTTKPTTAKPATAKPTTAKPALPTTKTTTKPAITTNPATKTTTKLAMTTTKPVTAKPRTTAVATTKESTAEIESTTKPITRTTNSFSDTTSKETETTSLPVTEPKQKPSEITMTTTERRSPGNDKILDTSRDHSSSRSTTVVVVSVLCTLVVLAALSFMSICLLRKKKRPKKAMINSDSNNQIDKQENHVYQTQDNVYQLLRYDGKSTAHEQWEPPAYQGLAKGSPEGNWGEGEVYTNPSMYQDLKKNEAVSNGEYLPAYHPLMKSTMEKVPEYDCGYLVLVGEHDKKQDTADLENPYYFKVEQTIE